MREFIRNLKIGKKLTISFGIVILLCGVTMVMTIVSLRSISRRMERLYSEPFANVQTSQELIGNLQSVGKYLIMLVATDGVVDEEYYYNEIQSLIRQEEEGLSRLSTGYVSGPEKVRELEEQFALLTGPRDEVLRLWREGKEQEALSRYTADYAPQSSQVREVLAEVVKLSIQDAQGSLERSKEINEGIIVAVCAASVGIIAISVVLCMLLTRGVTHPINEVRRAAESIAGGQLAIDLQYTSRNELGLLAEDIRSTAAALESYVSEIRRGMAALGAGHLNYRRQVEFKGDFVAMGNALDEISCLLRESIQQISVSATQVSGGAAQVSTGAQTLAQGASEQAGSIQELAARINEIADGVQHNADSAVLSSQVAGQVGDSLRECSKQMEEALEAIRAIRRNSDEINSIVSEIEDIAFRTNILSLNASVEAARAGEAGRGFAVVANEVRHLASKTTEASKMTAELALQTTRTVDEGSQAADRTTESLKKVVDGVQRVSAMMDRISDASIRQADSIIQVRQSIDLISEIVQGNSATSEEKMCIRDRRMTGLPSTSAETTFSGFWAIRPLERERTMGAEQPA